MTDYLPYEEQCPCCYGTISFYGYPYSPQDKLGDVTTDLRQLWRGDSQPMHYVVHTCPLCGYTGTEVDYQTATLTLEDRIFVFAQLLQRCMAWNVRFHAGHQYRLFAILKEREGWSNTVLGDLHLHAAWCSGDLGLDKDEMYYRGKAVHYYQKALAEDELCPQTRASRTYLVAEQFRRIGDQESSALWFDEAIHEAAEAGDQRLVACATQQKSNPRDVFDDDIWDNPISLDFPKSSWDLVVDSIVGSKRSKHLRIISPRKETFSSRVFLRFLCLMSRADPTFFCRTPLWDWRREGKDGG